MVNNEKNGIERPPEFIKQGKRKEETAKKRERELNSRERKVRLQEDMEGDGPGLVYDAPPRKLPIVGLPNQEIASSTEKKEEKATKEIIEEHLLSFLQLDNENHIKYVLEELGYIPTIGDAKKISEALVKNPEELVSRISKKIIEKFGEEFIRQVIDVNEYDQIFDDKETSNEIVDEIKDTVKKYYGQIWQEKKKKGKLTAAQKENGPKLSSEVKAPAETEKLSIDRSGETDEQKELRKKIIEAIQKAVEENVAKINAKLAVIKSQAGGLAKEGIDEKRLEDDKEEISRQILDNLDGYVGPILQFLKDSLESQQLAQTVRIETALTVVNAFRRSSEISKILPKKRIRRQPISPDAEILGKVPAIEDVPREMIDFSKYTGVLSGKLIKQAEEAKGRNRAEIIELLETWNYVKGNLKPAQIELMENMLEEAVMNVYRRELEEGRKKSDFNVDKFNARFLEEIEAVLRRRQINKRDTLDFYRMYFEQAFIAEQEKQK